MSSWFSVWAVLVPLALASPSLGYAAGREEPSPPLDIGLRFGDFTIAPIIDMGPVYAVDAGGRDWPGRGGRAGSQVRMQTLPPRHEGQSLRLGAAISHSSGVTIIVDHASEDLSAGTLSHTLHVGLRWRY